MEIIKRKMAKQRGLGRYFTGLACKRGHIAERYTITGTCVVCAKERQEIYMIEHKEKANAIRAAWRERNYERWRAGVARYQATHKEKLKEAGIAWSKANREKLCAYAAKYNAANHEKVLARGSAWRARNRDKVNAKKSRRIAAKLKATPSWANDFFIAEAYNLAKLRTRVCGGLWHVDHIVPIRSPIVCGLHCETNLRVIPALVNQLKGNRHWPDMPT